MNKRIRAATDRNRPTGSMRVAFIVLLVVVFGVVACTQANDGVVEQTVIERTVEVTREVPVEVPVEVTREVIVEVESGEREVVVVTATPDPNPSESAAPAPADVEELLESIDYALIAEVWELLQNQYDGELPPDEALTDAIIVGLLESVSDDFTRYIPPEVAQRLREDMSGSFEGIGAFVGTNEEGEFEIVRPIDGQPAAAAGLQPRDVIIAVDGTDVTEMLSDEIVGMIRGPRGTDVTLTIKREGTPEPFDVTITRATIQIPIVQSELLEENIGYVRLSSFAANAEDQLAAAIAELQAENPLGLILDLRDNPGGFLDQSVAVADMFLDGGVILIERDATGFEQTFRADGGDLAETIPLVVLVNAGSASASEIVAGAVRDNERGTIIGETTFGKGSVQRPNVMSNQGELRVTIARWYTPNDQTIDEQGIAPDIEIANERIVIGGPDDLQLQRAIEFLLTGE